MAQTLEYPIRMDGSFPKDSLVLLGARIEEGINRLSRTEIEFVAEGSLDLEDLIGTEIRLTVEVPGALKRVFPGLCVAAEYLGHDLGAEHFTAELRPWFWVLSRTADSRVYQDTTVPDLIQAVLGEYGFSDIEKKLSGSYPAREFLLQYRESDLDFLTRIAEEEGIYFYFAEKNGKDMMVLADNSGAHGAIPGEATLPFRLREDKDRLQLEHVHDWSGGRTTQTGRITLNDYNFEKPKADMSVANAKGMGKHPHKSHEVYDYPGKYRTTGEGERFAKFRMEAEAIRNQAVRGAGAVSQVRVGHKFTLNDHPRKSENAEYMVTAVTHLLRLSDDHGRRLLGALPLGAVEDGTSCLATFEAVPAKEQFRPRAATPKPVIAGVQTAVVVGPDGEEIHTDKYGRVKIQFHWDREGKKDDKSSCWVRTMMPWTGKNWGMIHIPRIGQEVVVDFEEGDPDRPIVVGMVYNADTMPPYALDANKTQSGIKTNTSKGGGGYNELMFEDKKDAELVRFQSERDYEQIVKNNATITVGDVHQDAGDMTLTVQNHLTETVTAGDHTFKVEVGKETIEIARDQNQTIGGDQVEDVEGNRTQKVAGKKATTVNGASYTVDVSSGQMTISAAQKITLKCGGSTIELTPASIKINSVQVQVEGSAMLATKAGGMAKHEAGGMLSVGAPLVKIN